MGRDRRRPRSSQVGRRFVDRIARGSVALSSATSGVDVAAATPTEIHDVGAISLRLGDDLGGVLPHTAVGEEPRRLEAGLVGRLRL